jgi:hypothetical protein
MTSTTYNISFTYFVTKENKWDKNKNKNKKTMPEIA